MPRELSADTEYVYWWLWHWPWASAADIARITAQHASAIDIGAGIEANGGPRGQDSGPGGLYCSCQPEAKM